MRHLSISPILVPGFSDRLVLAPAEVAITGIKIKGVILSDYIKNLDWKARNVKFIEKAADNILEECIGKISTLLF